MINITFVQIPPRDLRFIKTHRLRDDKINRKKSPMLLINERFPFTVPVSRLGTVEADEIYRPKRPGRLIENRCFNLNALYNGCVSLDLSTRFGGGGRFRHGVNGVTMIRIR